MRSVHWWRTVFYLIPAVALYTIVLGTVSLLSTLFDRTGNVAHACARAWARWILEEIGVAYEIARLSFQNGEHKSAEYLAIHPHGSVPALTFWYSVSLRISTPTSRPMRKPERPKR